MQHVYIDNNVTTGYIARTMNLTGNTILITGGGSGIGRGLAEAFHSLDNQVIIAGRRQNVLEETAGANPGMASIALDINDPASVKEAAAKVTGLYPALNILINNAGVARVEDLKAPADPEKAGAIITTNLLGPIRLTSALLPHLLKQPRAAVINVTSGLGFVPFPVMPTYSATKAALHSYTVTLRVQLTGTPVEVLEIIPPYVQTELGGPTQAADPRAMPLKDFIAETMKRFKEGAPNGENCVEQARFLRTAEATGNFGKALDILGQLTLDPTHL